MTPDQIPTEITRLVYTAPLITDPTGRSFRPSQNDTAEFLAHFWSAIETCVRGQVAREILTNQDGSPWSMDRHPMQGGIDNWIDSRDAVKAATIARTGSAYQ